MYPYVHTCIESGNVEAAKNPNIIPLLTLSEQDPMLQKYLPHIAQALPKLGYLGFMDSGCGSPCTPNPKP